MAKKGRERERERESSRVEWRPAMTMWRAEEST